MLRFDGLYRSDPIQHDGGTPYREYLRFFSDATVVTASVQEPSTAEQVESWLWPGPGTPLGAYQAEGESLTFFAAIPESLDVRDGTVMDEIRSDYSGVFSTEGLSLSVDGRKPRVYRFCPAV